MTLPDLKADLAFWVAVLRLLDWRIAVRYVDDLSHPDTGEPVLGLCYPDAMRRTARILIRTPRTEAEAAEVPMTLLHEIMHCKHAPYGAAAAVEEPIVEDLAEALTTLRGTDPARFTAMARVLARPDQMLLASRVRARAGGSRTRMRDPKLLAELALSGGALTALDGMPPEAVEWIQKAVGAMSADASAAAADDGAAGGEGEGPKPQAGAGDKAQMGTSPAAQEPGVKEDKSPLARKVRELEERQAKDRAAAIDLALDARPDLAAEQKAYARARGLEGGVEALSAYLGTLRASGGAQPGAPAPSARMGVDRAPRGREGADEAGYKPKALDEHLDQAMGLGGPSGGVMMKREPGKLVVFSHLAPKSAKRARAQERSQ